MVLSTVYVTQLPTAGEFVLFNRSWYNRAGVEKVMGFCTDEQYKQFMNTVNDFESLLVGSDIELMKYYLDINKEEQALRLKDRAKDPLKQWKISPIDQKAQKCGTPTQMQETRCSSTPAQQTHLGLSLAQMIRNWLI
jgi:polyphosphate kinase 2 (PPK2 family)